MSGLVRRVRESVDVGCIATAISKEGCGVSLDGTPTGRVIVDLDEPSSPLPPPNQRCDYLFAADATDGPGWVAPLELKGGRFDASEISGQLQAGARAAEQLVPQNVAVRFRPIAVIRRGSHKAERQEARKKKNWVRFRGSARELRLMKCGQKLADQLRK